MILAGPAESILLYLDYLFVAKSVGGQKTAITRGRIKKRVLTFVFVAKTKF